MPIFEDSDRLTFVSDGQRVTLALRDGCGLPCVVTKAAGNHAYVESVKTGRCSGWVAVWQLFPEVTPAMRDKIKEPK